MTPRTGLGGNHRRGRIFAKGGEFNYNVKMVEYYVDNEEGKPKYYGK